MSDGLWNFYLRYIFFFEKKEVLKNIAVARGSPSRERCVRHMEISGVTQYILCSKFHDFLASFGLAH